MKKIPTLFERVFKDHHIEKILPVVTNGLEWVLEGEGVATVKFDGACCAIIDGVFYKRYDAKRGKPIPEGAIKCQELPDPITGHYPVWIKVDRENPSDKWFCAAYDFYTNAMGIEDGTYEAVGKHFQGDPYYLKGDLLMKHGAMVIEELQGERTFEQIRDYLQNNYIEGIVFWKDGEPQCKIKRSDFGFSWGARSK